MRKTLIFSGARGGAVLAMAALALVGCDASDLGSGAGAGAGEDSDRTTGVAADATPKVTVNVAKGARGVAVSTLVKVRAEHAKLSSVRVTSSEGAVDGELSADGAKWAATDRLEPGVRYTVTSVGTSETGDPVRTVSRFTTQALSLSQQTYASVAPLQGEKVGVGMPVIVTFDVPVTNKKKFQDHMKVTSTPAQPGAWHWLSSTEARWRPKHYWKPGTEVSVDADVNGVPAGAGIFGQMDKHVDFTVGAAHIYRVNMVTHQMKVLSNGKLLRTIPITTGKPGFSIRTGTKVIIEKFESKTMNSETVGITGADAYNIKGVKYAMRLTYSGEFIHAAPWSVGSQGHANVSHGCTGMSTENAAWLFDLSRRGDVVEFTGSSRPMEPTNGYGDWNIPFKEYRQGSAA